MYNGHKLQWNHFVVIISNVFQTVMVINYEDIEYKN